MALQQYRIGNTYYGYDPATGQLIAFSSPQEFQKYFPSFNPNAPQLPIDPAPANARPNTMVSLGTSGGSSPTPSAPAPTGSSSPLYGNTKNPDLEREAADAIGTFFTTLKRDGTISQAAFNATINNPQNMARYIQGWAYGGYTLDDIFREVKGKDLGQNIQTVNPSMTAQQYYQSPQYAAIKNNTALNPPINSSIDPNLWNNPIFAIPGDAFKTLVPVIDINSPQFKEEASKIQDAYYDLLIQQVESNTAQAKAIADDNYRLFKQQVERQYGYKLADDAVAAWGQIQQLTTSAVGNNLLQSGIYNEALDKYLAQRRRADSRVREERLSAEEAKKREYYVNQASPEQIKKDLTDAERERWGLKPTQELLDFIKSLKSKYPDLSDADIARMKGALVDDFGNLRSQLFNQLYSNKYNLTQSKSIAQQQTLLNQKLAESEKAYAPYTQSDNPFLRFEEAVQPTDPFFQTPTQPTQQPAGLQMPTTSYSTLINMGGTVYNTATNRAYSSPQELAADLGISADQIQWNQIGKLSYNNLVNKNNTIFNTLTGQGYSSPDQLAKALGVPVNQIQWNQIQTNPNWSYQNTTSPAPTQQTQTNTPPPGGLQMPTSTAPTTAPKPTTTTTDLSSKYGLYNGTVYNLSTGYGYSSPTSFFKDAGVSSFDNLKLDTSYQPKFYKYSDNPTVYNYYTNKPLDYNSYLLSGGNKDFSGIEVRTR